MGPVPLVLAIVTTCFCFIYGQTVCVSPGGTNGTCRSIEECPTLLEISRNDNKSQQDLDLLKKSQCNFEGGLSKVCCTDANPCYTPDGDPGTCISIYACPHLANLVKPSISRDNTEYLQASRCAGSEQYSVCCGQPRDKNALVLHGNCAAKVSAYPPNPRTDCCGTGVDTHNYLISYETSVDQYPWLAIIEYVKDDQIKLLCGGVLISGRYLLTAAHCVDGDILKIGTPKSVRLGEYDIPNEGMDCKEVEAGGLDCSEGTSTIPIQKTISHPDYSSSRNPSRNDIALIRLAQNAPYTDFIRPICLPSADVTVTTSPYEYLYTSAAGWGLKPTTQPSSNKKLYTNLPYVTNNVCEEAYKSSGLMNLELTTGQLCAGSVHAKETCMGDSGGPLMSEKGRHVEVIGVNSFNPTPCNVANVSGVYTKVFEYMNWIRNNIEA